jgi:uncharacterized lipoprotein YehR (DUF1307 family)
MAYSKIVFLILIAIFAIALSGCGDKEKTSDLGKEFSKMVK